MTRNPTRSRTATAEPNVVDPTPRTQVRASDREPDPVQNPGSYARTVLHHLLAYGDLLGEDADGNVVILFKLPRDDFDRLATFDPDGDPDVELQ